MRRCASTSAKKRNIFGQDGCHMKILLLVASFPPIIDSAARLYSELSESLVEMGNHVNVITEHPAENSPVDYSHGYFKKKYSEKAHKNIYVRRISPLEFLLIIPGGKALRFMVSLLLYTFQGLCLVRPDVILVYSPPLFMGISGYIIAKIKKTRFVFNMQDIHPNVLFDSGDIKNSLIKKILSGMESFIYRKAQSFIVYSTGNREYLLRKKVVGEIFIIPNWMDNIAICSHNKRDSIRKEKSIGDKFVVSYAGSMQPAQGLEIIVETAEAIKEHDNIIFLLAGEGPSKSILKSLIIKKKIDNVLLCPVMPKERYFQFLNESDVCLITLSSDIPVQTIPGKLADIMGCGKPVIAVVNQKGDAARIIKKAGCGFCVDPGDVGAFSRGVLKLHRDERLRKEMGENARKFAERYFSRSVCTKQYEEVLRSAMRKDRSRRNGKMMTKSLL